MIETTTTLSLPWDLEGGVGTRSVRTRGHSGWVAIFGEGRAGGGLAAAEEEEEEEEEGAPGADVPLLWLRLDPEYECVMQVPER